MNPLGHVMRSPGAILLVSCYEMGHQPLGLASPLAFLNRAGFAPVGMDIARGSLDEESLSRAKFVGISAPMHTALRLGVQFAKRVRSINPRCHICFYGLYAPLNAEYLLSTCAESIVGGEYEASLVGLVEALEAGQPVDAIEGIICGGEPAAPVLRRLDFPVPLRNGLERLEDYAQLQRNGHQHLVGYVEATRGCRHLCLHCPIPSVYAGRFFVVPKEIVLEDIHNLVVQGAKHITFGDPDFLNGPGHSLAIVRAMHEEFPQLTYDFTAKVEHLLKHRALLPELAAQGCAFVVSAVESLSDTVLAHLEKGHTCADVTQVLELLRSCGTPLRPSLVSFTPWTTLDDYLDVLDFVDAEGLIDHIDPVQYTIRLLVPPGSGLLLRPAIQPFLDGLDEAALTYRWKHPDPRMDELHHAVSCLVEEASDRSDDSAVVLTRIKALAFGMHERRVPAPDSGPIRPDRSRPPRLTEPWFC